MGPKSTNKNKKKLGEGTSANDAQRATRLTHQKVDVSNTTNIRNDKDNEQSDESDNESEFNKLPMAKKGKYISVPNNTTFDDDVSSESSSVNIRVNQTKGPYKDTSKYTRQNEEGNDNDNAETRTFDDAQQSNNINNFDLQLEKSKVFQQMIGNQNKIFDQLKIITDVHTGQSNFAASRITPLIKLSQEQKSIISQVMRNMISRIKFLRKAEWNHFGEKLLNPIFDAMNLKDEEEQQPYINIVKSCASGCINQKRAELMRLIKPVAIGKCNMRGDLFDTIVTNVQLKHYIIKTKLCYNNSDIFV